ncbi:MAG TPA: hypothetical protein P5121_35405 [Caldilineaceae bacterium]|nr:hypothetical protein [Caldilineaceae bacterium]HRW10463.1 hypothetical protein [Caldilineaceae bacterium]
MVLEQLWLILLLVGGLLVAIARFSSLVTDNPPRFLKLTTGAWGAILIVLGVITVVVTGLN